MPSKSSIVGVDIGASSVKAVFLTELNGQFTLTDAACVDIGPGEGQGDQEPLKAAVKEVLSRMELEGAKIYCVVNCPQTIVRNIIAPHMPAQELKEAIKWEIKNYVPFSMEEAVLDFEVLGEIVEKGTRKLNVIVAVSPRKTISDILSVFFSEGMKVAALIPAPIALQNSIARSSLGAEAGKAVAFLELGAAITELNIYKDGRLQFSRKLPVAGCDITKALTETLSSEKGQTALSLDEAERVKKEHGLPSAGEASWAEDKISAQQTLSLIRPCVEQLAVEMERSFDYYREESHGGRVERIVLGGGGSRLKGLKEFLHAELGVDVSASDDFEIVFPMAPESKERGASQACRWNLALGAAFAGLQGKGINLLPSEIKEEGRRFIERVSLNAVMAAAVTTAFLAYLGGHMHLAMLQRKMEVLQTEHGRLLPSLKGFEEKALIGNIVGNKPHWEDVLKEISNIVPSYMYLTEIRQESDIVYLSGAIVKNAPRGQTDEILLSDFMLTLEKGILKNVTLVSTAKTEGPQATSVFEIKAEVE